MSDHQPVVEPGNQGFDPGEVDAGTASIFGGVIIAVIIAVFIGVTLYWDRFLVGRYRDVVEAAPNTQLQDLRKSEAVTLGGYAYTDRNAGKVRIPVDRAMQLVIEEAKAGKSAYNVKDSPKLAEEAAPAAAPAGAPPAPAAAPQH